MSSIEIPEEILLDFFERATRALEHVSVETLGTASLKRIRQIVLNEQTECLRSVAALSGVSTQQLEGSIACCSKDNSSSNVQRSVDHMNNAARQSFCRLCLQADWSKHDLTSAGQVKDADILEFCGMCEVAVTLPQVLNFLRTGKPLWGIDCDTIFPQKRLESIQRQFLIALGYDPDFGTREIKKRFYYCCEDQKEQDALSHTFNVMAEKMRTVLTEATTAAMHDNFFSEDDGVTRVVSVQYSEKILDEKTGQEITAVDAAPRSESMSEQVNGEDIEQRREQLRLAREASFVQQEILGELLSMRDEEREVMLSEAKQVTDAFLQEATKMPAGPERISFLTSIDPKTQRFLVMHKLWDRMLAVNGGKSPKNEVVPY